jgi:cytochrome c oxidase subunit IV
MTEHEDQPNHGHPSTSTYITIAAILTVLTLVEVGVFYVPAFGPVLAPLLLLLSATKFVLVVMFYMHLKSDSRLFTFILSAPLLLAGFVGLTLMFLFGSWLLN